MRDKQLAPVALGKHVALQVSDVSSGSEHDLSLGEQQAVNRNFEALTFHSSAKHQPAARSQQRSSGTSSVRYKRVTRFQPPLSNAADSAFSDAVSRMPWQG